MSRAETISEVDLDELFNTLDPKTVADFKKVIKGFATSYDGVGAAGQRGLQVPEPVPLDLAADLRRADPRHAGARAADRRRLAALASGRLAPRRPLGAGREPRPDDERDRPSADVAADRALAAARLHAQLQHDGGQPAGDARRPRPARRRLQARRRRASARSSANFRAASADLVPTVRDLDQIVAAPGKRQRPRRPDPAAATPGEDRRRSRQPPRRAAPGRLPRVGAALRDSLDELAFFRAYSPELTGWFDDFGHSGVIDANGGIGRIGTTFNTFSLSANDLPIVDLTGLLSSPPTSSTSWARPAPAPRHRQLPALPGLERAAGAGRLQPVDRGGDACDPAIIPPGD